MPVPGFPCRLPITVSNTANTTSALSYYQASVMLSGSAYTFWHANGKADGSDLRVTDSDTTTPLSFALEGIDTTNSVVYLLVKVPALAAGATRTIYVHFGNAAATSVSSYATTVGPTTAIVGPTDILTQSDVAGYNDGSWMVLFKNQHKAHGGGAGLNGKIYLISNTGQSGNPSTGGSITSTVSSDGGLTWGAKTALATADSTHGFSAQSLTELADGTLLMCYAYDLGTTFSAGFEHWYIARSTDGGTTWSNLSTTPANPVTGPWTYGTDIAVLYGPLIETAAGGTLYKTAYGALSGQTYWREWLLKCSGGSDPTIGSNWSLQGTIANDGVNQYAENSILNTGGNNWISVTRNQTGTGDLYLCSSSDNGATWSTPVAIGLSGTLSNGTNLATSPNLTRLASGNILLTFGIRYPAAPATWGCAAVISTDNGVSWVDRAAAIPLGYSTSGVASSADFGYPSAVQNADGSIVITGYREVGGVNTTTNIARSIVTEDWLVNSPNLYDGCESFSANWTHGANASISTTHAHNGTSAVKIDNSAATGGINDWATVNLWSTNPATQNPRVAVSYWAYEAANDTSRTAIVKDSTGAFNTSTGNRFRVSVVGVTSDHIEWYNGTAFTDTGVSAPANQWHKITNRASALASSVTGQILLNNASVTTTQGQEGSGGNPQSLTFVGASLAATHNVTYWIDDLYTHQYTPNIPTITPGAGIVAGYLMGETEENNRAA